MSYFFVLLFLAALPIEQFQRANRLYEASQFQEAVVLYDSALKFLAAAEIYYNRGNAHFKSGELGYALADYLRAAALKPHDPDIKNNIAFVRNFRPDKNPNPESPLSTVVRTIFTPFPFLTTRLLAGVMFFLLALSFAFFLATGRSGFGYGAIGLAVVFLYFGVATVVGRGIVNPAKAVVVVPEAILRSGPGEEYKDIAAVHDGLEVKILGQRTGYFLIQIPGGVGGWVEDRAIERVFGQP